MRFTICRLAAPGGTNAPIPPQSWHKVMGLHFAETLTTMKMQINRKSFNGGKLFILKFIATHREIASSGVIMVTAGLPANTFQ
jgi:hypothetical protein